MSKKKRPIFDEEDSESEESRLQEFLSSLRKNDAPPKLPEQPKEEIPPEPDMPSLSGTF